jgi:hypothetical protein
MANNLERGVELWGSLAELLNDIILHTGKQIQKDNKAIWDGFLHKWSNQDWMTALEAVAHLAQTHPEVFHKGQKETIGEAVKTLLKGSPYYERVMDRKMNKSIEWRTIMVMRELWNQARAVDIPNEDSEITYKRFTGLFDMA